LQRQYYENGLGHLSFFVDWTYVAFDSFEDFPEIKEIDKQEIFKKKEKRK